MREFDIFEDENRGLQEILELGANHLDNDDAKDIEDSDHGNVAAVNQTESRKIKDNQGARGLMVINAENLQENQTRNSQNCCNIM